MYTLKTKRFWTHDIFEGVNQAWSNWDEAKTMLFWNPQLFVPVVGKIHLVPCPTTFNKNGQYKFSFI